MELIKASNWQEFPPRLPEQPIFYPVLTYEYADLIITNWNINEEFSGYVGYITKFEVDLEYIVKFKVEIAGGPQLQELWVPSEELTEFNKHIVTKIKIVEVQYGKLFGGWQN